MGCTDTFATSDRSRVWGVPQRTEPPDRPHTAKVYSFGPLARQGVGPEADLRAPGTSLPFIASGKDSIRVVYEDVDSYSDETMTQTVTRLN